MAIDPSKLQAFAQHGGDHDEGEEGPPSSKGGGPESGEGGKDYGPLEAALQEHADDVEQCVDELDPDALDNPDADMSPEDVEILKEGFEALDPGLKKEVERCVGGISFQDAQEIGEHLADAEHVEDGDRVGGWLYRLGEHVVHGDGDHDEDDEEGPPSSEQGGGEEHDDGGPPSSKGG